MSLKSAVGPYEWGLSGGCCWPLLEAHQNMGPLSVADVCVCIGAHRHVQITALCVIVCRGHCAAVVQL